jgi:hypothetical protein
MKWLIDNSTSVVKEKQEAYPDLVAGQLCTPLTRNTCWGDTFAMDNGAFSRFDIAGYLRMLERHKQHMDSCLFLTIPDVVGNAKRTKELYFAFTVKYRDELLPWVERWSYVAQDGCENEFFDWAAIRYLFIGGTTRWKDSQACYDIVRTAKSLDIPVHVGRVNTIKRYKTFAALGADTCDGSGISRFDHMLEDVVRALQEVPHPQLFDTK